MFNNLIMRDLIRKEADTLALDLKNDKHLNKKKSKKKSDQIFIYSILVIFAIILLSLLF